MATVTVVDSETGKQCDVSRLRYPVGDDFSYLVLGKSQSDDFLIDEVIIDVFKDLGAALDLVDRLDAMLHDEKKDLPPEKMII